MGKLTLAAARVANGWTQEELADRMGISREAVNKIENGKIRVKPFHVYAYCYITGFKADDFLLPFELTESKSE